MKLKSWRLAGVVAFTVFALMELGDWAGLVPGYTNPKPYADLVGIDPKAESARLLVLSVLALGIALSSGLTAFALVRKMNWALGASRMVAGLFGLYGVYQIVSANIQLGANQRVIMVVGGMYLLLGGLAWWLGTWANPARCRQTQ